ncbi:MAG: 2-oxo-4-hydroxy-4-carboxy-5-ureidoimidazoline decarboxylase [Verrucomicrobiota bacterium]
MITLEKLDTLSASEFVSTLEQVYEHSPWVVEAVAGARPFANLKVLQAACESALYGADPEIQMELIKAHPDLAAKLDQLPKLTDFSQAEQRRAGFAALAPEVLERMRVALAVYRERFGHPFILCVTEHPAEDVLPLLELRCQSTADAERLACLYQIARIGWYRINGLVREA